MLTVKSLPIRLFSHIFSSEKYANTLSPSIDKIEITYIEKGSLCYRCNDKSGILAPGGLFVNFNSDSISFSSDEYHCHRTVCFELDHSKDIDDGFLHLPSVSPDVLSAVDKIIRISAMENKRELTAVGEFLKLLDLICKEHDKIQSDGAGYGEYRYTEKAKSYVWDHIGEDILQRDAAKALGVSPEYLCAVFKKCEGTSFIKYVNSVKLRMLISLMRDKGITLSQASALLGFSDPNYVSRLYRRYYGTTLTDALSKDINKKIGEQP
jgi:AraC-like DNA-binding protein